MSEEEIIEEVEKELKLAKNIDDVATTIRNEYIQGLLDLYNKEKLNSFNLSEQLNKEKEKNKKIEDKIKGKINNLEIFRKTLPIRATEIERFIGELKDLLEE